MNKLEKLRAKMAEASIDALLISNRSNIYYISDFYAEAGVATLLITQQDAYLMSDGRFMSEAKESTQGFHIVRWKTGMYEDMGELIDALHIPLIAVEDATLSYAEAKILKKYTKAELMQAPNIIETLRSIKSSYELPCIRKACDIADEAFKEVLRFIKPGVSEQEVCNELEFQMRKRGATTCSFEIIVASGKRGALPHGVASEKIIEKGDMVTMDFGALYKHYCSDITRTVAVGEPDKELI